MSNVKFQMPNTEPGSQPMMIGKAGISRERRRIHNTADYGPPIADVMPANRYWRVCALECLIFTALAVLFSDSLPAQPLKQEINPVIVRESRNEELRNPFTGGLDLTRIGLLDIDGNGRADLFTLNLSERLRLYHNEGTFPFRLDTSSFWRDISVRSWFRFADIDGDGDADLFTSGGRSEMMILRNDGTNLSPLFIAPDTLRQSGGEVLYTELQTVPTFVDIDADEDLDLFSGNIDGSITFYENTGTQTSPGFQFRTARFEGIIVFSPAQLEDEKEGEIQSGLHGASVIDFVDLDNDEDLDMLFGDFFTERLLHFENRGTRFQPDFDTLWLDTAFAPNGDLVESQGFNQAVSGDLDLDGDIDVIVSSLLASSGNRPVELYVNEGTVSEPVMRRSTINLTSEIDVGRMAAPALLRDDERYGLMVGSEDGSISWYEIVEEGGRTVWRLSRRYILDGVTLSAPTAGDLDGDGRAEIVVGKADAEDGSTLRLYRFKGSELVHVPWQLDTSANVVRGNASPTLVDIEGDDDLDLIVGGRNGRIFLFENIGTPSAPLFEARTPPAPFNLLDVDQDSAPRAGDLDGDGDPDLMIGGRSTQGLGMDTIRFWLNDGGSFREDPDWPPMAVAFSPVPMSATFAEGRFLFIGAKAGGLLAFADTTSISGIAEERGSLESSFYVSPETISGDEGLSLRWSGMKDIGPEKKFVVVDLTGRVTLSMELKQSSGSATLSLEDLPSGTYFWRVPGAASGAIRIVR